MPFDFRKVKSTKTNPNIDPDWDNPIKFFYKLSHPSIKDLYPIQHGLLKEWYFSFEKNNNDNLISLDTGAGKTLIGLLIAESIRRNKKGKVVYLCPNNYLVAQTKEKAKDYGILVSTYTGGRWSNKNNYLENKAICITNYDSLFNSRSVFKDNDIKGAIFDDVHLSIELIDKQFTITISETECEIRKKIIDLFSNLPETKSKIELIKQGDPNTTLMIPVAEWMARFEIVKEIIGNSKSISESFSWVNLREKLKQSICFISCNKIEISLLYPDIKDHFLLKENIARAYLSATMSNMDDITRMFNVVPNRIIFENFDYRPERLFIFSEKTKITNSDTALRNNMGQIRDKTLVLVPSRKDFISYQNLDNVEFVENATEAEIKINNFKTSAKQVLVLANRYDGIDLQGDACRLLVVDKFPFIGSLKVRYFSEFFTKDRNDFLRSYLSSKITQAFGRTLRGYDDYSVIFVLDKKLNDFLINKDNERFFKKDLIQDLEIGKNISSSIENAGDLKSLCDKMLSREDDWKEYIDNERVKITDADSLSDKELEFTAEIASCERNIVNAYYSGDFLKTIELIEKNQKKLETFSKSILGIYLSIASICQIELDNISEAVKYSERAFGINHLFGKLDLKYDIQKSEQAKLIYKQDKAIVPNFEWNNKNLNFEEDIKKLGELLGFRSWRPEKEKKGTLDVLWEDTERKIVLGLELKSNKSNYCLSKKEIDQNLGHLFWINKNYKDCKKYLFVVGELNSYNSLASPANVLFYLNFEDLNLITQKIKELYKLKKIMPNLIDSEIDRLDLRIDQLFDLKRITDLQKESFY